jgi:hypothetical protein
MIDFEGEGRGGKGRKGKGREGKGRGSADSFFVLDDRI